MAETAKFEQTAQARPQTRVKAEHRYPVYDLDDSIAVARAIRDQGGGSATIQQLGSFLNYSSTRSGSFISRMAAARQFGLIQSSDRFINPTALANRIIAPEHPGVDELVARIEAFMNVPLYRSLYERYKNGPLPQEMGVRNVLETHYNIPRARTTVAYRVFMDSAEQAGFFQARAGARTHLVMPVIRPHEGEDQFEQPEEEGSARQETIRDQPPAPIRTKHRGRPHKAAPADTC